MELNWVRDDNPAWDDDKQRVIGGSPPGALELTYSPGTSLPGDWWSARNSEGAVLGYGWLDATWGGDAEVLLAVDGNAQGQGVGSFILRNLENEAGRKGLNYVYNTVRATHPDREGVHDWLAVRGYKGSSTDTALRKRTQVETGPAGPAPARTSATASPGSMDGAMPPGHEESGGYVDIEKHQY